MTGSSEAVPGVTTRHWESEILALEQRRQRALVDVDLPALESMFDDELIHVHSVGLVHDKAGVLAHIGRRRGFIAIERGPLTVRIHGTLAVMTGRMTSRMRRPDGEGEVVMDGFVTQVLRRHEDGWKFTHFQLTLSREAPAANGFRGQGT